MAVDFVEPFCQRYLGDYVVGRYGFNGVIVHDQYLAISRCLRRLVVVPT